MIGFERTVTILNQWYDRASKKTVWHKTQVTGVSVAGKDGVRVTKGLSEDSTYRLRIPKSAMPPDFLPPIEYANQNEVGASWTLQNGDVVVFSEVAETVVDITAIKRAYLHMTITAVHLENLHRLLPHIKIEGK